MLKKNHGYDFVGDFNGDLFYTMDDKKLYHR